MKKSLSFLSALVLCCALSACGGQGAGTGASQAPTTPQPTQPPVSTQPLETPEPSTSADVPALSAPVDETAGDGHILIAYFAYGENAPLADGVDASTSASIQYRDGELTGNTGLVAGMIADATGGDLFSILTVEQYPDNYDDTIDVGQEEKRAKVIAAQAVLEEDIWDMELIQRRLPTVPPIPMGAVVTASGTGAEMNGGAVITHEEKKVKTGIFAAAPRFAVLDPDYTMSVPFSQVISGAFDTLSHAMETYFGRADRDNVSDDLAEAVMRSTIRNMRTLLRDLNDYIARSNLMWDSAMAENGILKCGRATDFQAHQIEHQLGAYTDCNHGQGLAVIHPALYRVMCQKAPEKFARFAVNVWGISSQGKTARELAVAGVDALAEFIKACGLPTRLGELQMKGVLTEDTLPAIADSCNLIQTGQAQVNREEILDILRGVL